MSPSLSMDDFSGSWIRYQLGDNQSVFITNFVPGEKRQKRSGYFVRIIKLDISGISVAGLAGLTRHVIWPIQKLQRCLAQQRVSHAEVLSAGRSDRYFGEHAPIHAASRYPIGRIAAGS